jgi:hypothetical protein
MVRDGVGNPRGNVMLLIKVGFLTTAARGARALLMSE